MTTDYERGFAAGVEAAVEAAVQSALSRACPVYPPCPCSDFERQFVERLRSLRPSPAPTPKEDAPRPPEPFPDSRCAHCGHRADAHEYGTEECEKCSCAEFVRPRAPASDAAPPVPMEEGKIHKGGVNRDYQITQRPPDPPPMKPAATGGRCEACDGVGFEVSSGPTVCDACGGTGRSPSTGGDE